MPEERISMSQPERERLKVLQQMEQGHWTQMEGAQRLRLSSRQVRRIQRRVAAEGDGGVIHRLRGRPSNRKIPEKVQTRVLAEVRRRYADFGPTLAAEHLAAEGMEVSRETLRRWMSAAGLWRSRRRRLRAIHVWRERRAAFGELVMMDSSPFRWLEDRRSGLQLIALIDDASSRVWARFAEHDSTEENLRTLRGWLQRHGRPLALYTDKNSLFVTSRPVQWQEQLRDQPARTQFGRALHELGIEWIAAHSPQAKGRIERLFRTLQDRLVKEMRLRGIETLEQANYYLQSTFLPWWQQRFARLARDPRDAHRRLERKQRLEQILSIREKRLVSPDHTVSWQGRRWGLRRDQVCAGLRGARVDIERRLDGSTWLRFRGRYLSLAHCPAAPSAPITPSGLRPPGLIDPRKTKPKPQYIPPSDHPWRRTFLLGRKPDISTLR